MKTCGKCQIQKPEADFNKSTKSKDGLHSYCRECHKAHYRMNAAAHKQRVSVRRNQLRADNFEKYLDYMSDKSCADCGEEDPVVLEFDHNDPSVKSYSISVMMGGAHSWVSILAEMEKCTIRCSNCHKRRTAQQFGWRKALINASVG